MSLKNAARMKIEFHGSIAPVALAISRMKRNLNDDNQILTAAIDEAKSSLERFEEASPIAETREIRELFPGILGLTEAYSKLQMKLDLAFRACERLTAAMGEGVPIVD